MTGDSTLLLVGLSCLVLTVALLAFAVARALAPPTLAQTMIGALEQYQAASGAVPADQGDGGARERLLEPALAGLHRVSLLLSPAGVHRKLARKLDIAGNPPGWTVERVLTAKALALPVMAVIGGYIVAFLLGTPPFLTGLAAAAGGFFLPDLLLKSKGQARQEEIRLSLADSLDLLTVCVEAGLGFDAALRQVARNGRGPLAAEFVRVLQEMQIGKSRSEALRALADRTTVSELKHVVAALVQADALGIPVASVLRTQAREMRVKRRQLAEEKAQKVTIKILFPLFFCIFPALFIVLIGPGAISIMEAFSET